MADWFRFQAPALAWRGVRTSVTIEEDLRVDLWSAGAAGIVRLTTDGNCQLDVTSAGGDPLVERVAHVDDMESFARAAGEVVHSLITAA